MPESKPETTELVAILRSPANWLREDRGQAWKDGVSRYDRAPFAAADEIERLLTWLQNISDVHDARSELFTNDEDCAGSLADRARAALKGKTYAAG